MRLVNIDSLLIKDLLLPDSRTRISGFGVTFVRDTRQNCSVKYSLLDLIAKGRMTDPCRYNAQDPTRGDYLTADYNVSLPFLGANIGFQKFQASYNYYYTFPAVKGRSTTLAARAILGARQRVLRRQPLYKCRVSLTEWSAADQRTVFRAAARTICADLILKRPDRVSSSCPRNISQQPR